MNTSKYSLTIPNISTHGFGCLHPPSFEINNRFETSHVALNVDVFVGMGVHNIVHNTIPMEDIRPNMVINESFFSLAYTTTHFF